MWLKEIPQPELEQDAGEVGRWFHRGLPWVVCRHRGKPEHVSLGFCVASDSPGRRPRRFAVQAPHDHVLRMELPPSLATVSDRCGSDALATLTATASAESLNLHVFGSWMWQALTGDSYVNAASDLDILLDVTSEAEASRAVAFLQRQESACPIKIDGEFSLPGRGEVHWREYGCDSPTLLLKSMTTVQLLPRENLWR